MLRGASPGEKHAPKMTQKILAIQCLAFLDSVQTVAVFLNYGYETVSLKSHGYPISSVGMV